MKLRGQNNKTIENIARFFANSNFIILVIVTKVYDKLQSIH